METSSSIPIIKLGKNLIVSIQGSLHDRLALKLLEDVSQKIVKTKAGGLIVDVSAVDIMDSFIARTLNDIGMNAKTMGTETVLVGIQPSVALTLIEMGMSLDNVHTALDLEDALAHLEKMRNGKEEDSGKK